jgi:hypothetical protein
MFEELVQELVHKTHTVQQAGVQQVLQEVDQKDLLRKLREQEGLAEGHKTQM